MTLITMTNTVVCDGCGVEITLAAVVLDGKTYCCQDCAEGRVCACDYPPEESHTDQQPTLVALADHA
jgi:hypothetical protein